MPRKSEPFSMRLSSTLDSFVEREARRTKRSKGAVIESLADEAARSRRFPGIAFRGTDWSRRPWVIGTALDVWEIVAAYRDFDSVERMVAETDLADRQVRLALAYNGAFSHEIDDAIAENRRSLDELRSEFPTFDAISTTG